MSRRNRQPDPASQQPRFDRSRAPVFFYGAQNNFGQLSNMYPSSFKNSIFTYGPPKYREYCCVEQFFQHAKALWAMDTGSSDAIMKTSDPKKHKALGKKVKNLDVKEWNDVSYKVMLKAVGLKFTVSKTSTALRTVLLATSDREIVETSTDMTWGCGLTLEQAKTHKGLWPGKNLLGKALMEIRQELADEQGRQTCGFAAPNDAVAGEPNEQTPDSNTPEKDVELQRLYDERRRDEYQNKKPYDQWPDNYLKREHEERHMLPCGESRADITEQLTAEDKFRQRFTIPVDAHKIVPIRKDGPSVLICEEANSVLLPDELSLFVVDGDTYSSVNQFFQVAKATFFRDTHARDRILGLQKAAEIRMEGRKVKPFDTVTWSHRSEQVMAKGLRMLFTKSDDAATLTRRLLATRGKELVVATPCMIWGVGLAYEMAVTHVGPWPGRNLLGHCLQRLRGELQSVAPGQRQVDKQTVVERAHAMLRDNGSTSTRAGDNGTPQEIDMDTTADGSANHGGVKPGLSLPQVDGGPIKSRPLASKTTDVSTITEKMGTAHVTNSGVILAEGGNILDGGAAAVEHKWDGFFDEEEDEEAHPSKT